jgi:hypothetical protein
MNTAPTTSPCENRWHKSCSSCFSIHLPASYLLTLLAKKPLNAASTLRTTIDSDRTSQAASLIPPVNTTTPLFQNSSKLHPTKPVGPLLSAMLTNANLQAFLPALPVTRLRNKTPLQYAGGAPILKVEDPLTHRRPILKRNLITDTDAAR